MAKYIKDQRLQRGTSSLEGCEGYGGDFNGDGYDACEGYNALAREAKILVNGGRYGGIKRIVLNRGEAKIGLPGYGKVAGGQRAYTCFKLEDIEIARERVMDGFVDVDPDGLEDCMFL